MKKLLSRLVLVLAMIVCVGAITSGEAFAATGIAKASKNRVDYLNASMKNTSYEACITVSGAKKKTDIKNLKTDNAKVKAIARSKDVIALKCPKGFTGKVKVSFSLNGKTYSTSYSVKKYENPFTSVKINGTNITSRFDKEEASVKSLQAKELKFKAKEGWHISTIEEIGSDKTLAFKYLCNNGDLVKLYKDSNAFYFLCGFANCFHHVGAEKFVTFTSYANNISSVFYTCNRKKANNHILVIHLYNEKTGGTTQVYLKA